MEITSNYLEFPRIYFIKLGTETNLKIESETAKAAIMHKVNWVDNIKNGEWQIKRQESIMFTYNIETSIHNKTFRAAR